MAIVFVQQATPISGNAIAGSFAAITVTAGSLLVVLELVTTATDTTTAPTDGNGNVWSKAASVGLGAPLGRAVAVWYAPNAAAGATTVTINLSGAAGFRAALCEFSGIKAVSPVDKTATSSNAGVATPQTGTTATVSQTSTLAVGLVTDATLGALTAIGGTVGTWNALTWGNTESAAGYDIGASIGTFGAQSAASNTYAGVVVTFAAALLAGVPRRRRPKSKPNPLLRKRKPARRVLAGGGLIVLSPVPPRRHRPVKRILKKAPPRRKFHPFRFSQFVAAAFLAMVPPRHKPLRYPLVLHANRPPRRLRFPRRVVGYAATIYTQSLSATNTTTATVGQLLKTALVVTNTTAGTMRQFVQRTVSATMVTVGTVAQFIQQAVSATNTTTATAAAQQTLGFLLSATNTTTATVVQGVKIAAFVVTNTTAGQVVQSIQKTLRATNATTASVAIKAVHTFVITLVAHMVTTAFVFAGITPVIKQYTIKVTKVTSVIGIRVTHVRKAS